MLEFIHRRNGKISPNVETIVKSYVMLEMSYKAQTSGNSQ